MPWLQNSLLKEKVLQEKDGVSSRMLLQESVQSSVRLSLKPLLIQADERVAFFDSLLIAKLTSGSWFQKTSIANRPQTLLPWRKNCWGLLVHTRTLLPFSTFKRLSLGMCRIWNCLDMSVIVASVVSQRCWFQNSSAQFRDHGSLKRDVHQCSSEQLWWWRYMLQTWVKVWKYSRIASEVLLKYFVKVVEVVPETSILQAI